MSQPTGRVTAVMHDTNDLDRAVAFWTELLGIDVVHRDDTYVYLSKLSDGGPHLAFQLVDEPRSAKNRLHLDVRVADRSAFETRIESLGGRKIGEQNVPGYPQWSIMADPEGNEFCIYAATE